MAKDTFFCEKRTLKAGRGLLFLDEPLVMGILNVSPDSFFDGNIYTSSKEINQRVENMLLEGAGIIDIGGYSTRPGASEISEEEEIRRVIPAVQQIKNEFPDAILSIDTFRSRVAREAIDNGAHMINDVSGGRLDPEMHSWVAAAGVPYILMHMQGNPATMQKNPQYNDVVNEILFFFAEKTARLRQLGAKDIIIDPGFGFGKTVEHNYTLLRNLDIFKIFGLPVLAGFSRKSMINKVIGSRPEDALNGTTVLNTIALMKGVKILRVHDVKEAREAVQLWKMTDS